MIQDQNRYQTLLKAIDAERKHDEAFFKSLNESKTMQQKVNVGFVWYPVNIIRKSYTIGEYLEIEVQRTKNLENRHRFSDGMGGSIFNIQDVKVEFKVVVSSHGNGMRRYVVLLGESLFALEHLTREADDEVVRVSSAINGDAAKVSSIDFRGDTPVPS